MRTKFVGAVLLLTLHATLGHAQFGRPIIIPRPVTVPHIFPHPGHSGRSDDVNWPVLLSIVGGIAALAVGVYWYKHRPSSVRVRVITTPPGEAPEEVRRAWVGLELPLAAGEKDARDLDIAGVISGQVVGVTQGYAVDGKRAIRLLAGHDTHAAEWWWHNAPHVARSGYQLIFPVNVCEKVG
jgi:hypothetical protein